ncbi:replication-relaxation family protein [Asanoa sp. NPDC049518]|uniref:replication-relaxation family protein n=1 Tax=unclassified Asanoa TaxID=2685164 RepID=UPI003437A7CD
MASTRPSVPRPKTASSRVPAASSRPDPLAVYRRIVARDRLLLALLAEHYLLSTPQIAAAFFTGLRTAQRRLTILHRLGVVHRFALPGPDPGAAPFLYALGPVGLQLYPSAYHDPDGVHGRAPRSSLERARRIAASRKLAHLLGVNQFFIDLIRTARTTAPDGDGCRLGRWWSEQHATDVYAQAGIHPDGHGVWHACGHTVGFFLEHDNGTENLARVIAKLRGYERLAGFGPRYPVLLWLPSPAREANLLSALAGVPTAMPIATAVHGDDPAGPVWALSTSPARRRRLDELPSDHGPHAPTNPNRYDQ